MNAPRTFLTVFAACAALTALVFGKSLFYPFIYDDQWTIVRNQALRTAPWTRFFTDASTVAAPEAGIGNFIYRPLPTWTFAVNCRAGARPWAFRLPNLLLHALNGALLFFLLFTLLKCPPGPAAAGAALFLLHPAQVETVVWITQRSNLMCLAGVLGALLLAARGRGGAPLAYAAALFSKETAVTALPFLLTAVFLSAAEKRRKFRLGAQLLLMTAGYLFLRGAVVGGLAQRDWRGGVWENLLIGQASWWEYIKLIFFPRHLTASHFQYVDNPWEHPIPWLGMALAIAWGLAGVQAWRRGHRWAATVMAWVPAALAPHLGPLPLDTFVAERFLYLPLAGVGGATALLWMSAQKKVRWGMAGVLGLSAALSFARVPAWRSDLALWTNAVARAPGHAFARLCLAEAWYARGRWAEAAQSTRLALAANPSMPLVFAGLNNLANYALKENRPGAALRFAERALRIDPSSPLAFLNRDKARSALKN